KPAVAPDDGTPDSAGEACAHNNDCGNTGSTQTRPARFGRVDLLTRTADEGACSHEDFPWPPGIAKPGSAGLRTGRSGHRHETGVARAPVSASGDRGSLNVVGGTSIDRRICGFN